jgi:PAS domain S-box-containing protein
MTKNMKDLQSSSTIELTQIKDVLDAIPHGIMIINEEGKILHVNNSGSFLIGFKQSDFQENPLLTDFFRPSPHHHDPAQNELSGRSEFLLTTRSGKVIPVLKSSAPCLVGSHKIFIESFIDITERKRKMADLSESRRQFATLLSNLPGMVYRCRNDRNWTMEFVSDGCHQLTGYHPDELINNKVIAFNELIIPEDRERIWLEVQEKLNLKVPYTIEYQIKTADGRLKYVWEKANGIFNESGELLHLEGFISDITESRNANILQEVVFNISTASFTAQSLDELFLAIHQNLGKIIDTENFYVAMFDRENDTISLPYQVDSKDKFAKFPAGKTLTGYVIKTGKPLLVKKPEIEELAENGYIQIIGTPSQVWLGVPLIVDDTVTGVLAVQNYTDPDRYTIKDLELLTFVADQIATSIARRSAEDSLQKEKAYLDQLFEGSPEAIVMIDNSGIIMKVNSDFARLFGFQKSEIIGQNIDFMIAPPHNRAEAMRITREIAYGKDYEVETVRKHKDGHLIDVSLLVTPIMVQNNIFGAYGIYRDITSRKQAEKSLIAAKEKAEEADKLKSAFLSNMSHEIRTPMNAILGFSSLLSDPGLSDNEKGEFIQIIKDRGTDLMKIIDDIIDISKIESGQINFEIKDYPVNILMNNLMVTLNELKRKHDRRDVALNCYPGTMEPEFTIPTDGNRLRQILTNLIENALKFTNEGSVDFGYKLHKNDDPPYIEFFVRDTGIGIPKAMHTTIFERFRQVDDTATRKYGGTGLGLTIARNLSRLLGGEIWLESEEGKGTTFFVRLPLPSTKPMVIRPSAPKKVAPVQQRWDGKKILVVEDEESNFMLMERFLKSTGTSITWARNGVEAIDLVKTNHYDLVLMDVRMPIIDGYETTQVIRKTHKDLVIIAQTAFALKGEREKSLEAGCNNYIAKPINVSELFTILAQYLNK